MAITYTSAYNTLKSFEGIEIWDNVSLPQTLELEKYSNLKVGIIFKKWEEKDGEYFGLYRTNLNLVHIYVPYDQCNDVETMLHHELLHACQSAGAKQLIWDLAQNSSYWETSVRIVKERYSEEKRRIEYPVWALQREKATCESLIRKFLR